MKNKFILASTIFLLALSLTLISATPTSNKPGQPGAECGEDNATVTPHGFTTSGFAHAEEVYAGSDGSASSIHSNSVHAVSQYDVACFQLTQHQH